ncbi:MAG TPA: hypothetical protein VJJ83_03845 [Candidatus Babeliales bacterium]|nr:hypothetical protein [Candidatus Babeliales bacterium]
MIKSVIEEASSLEKAIELGWIKAGKPKEFTVKIFQEPVKNFLGISKQTAKIGLSFKEAGPAGTEGYNQRSQQGRRPYRQHPNRGQQRPSGGSGQQHGRRTGPYQRPQTPVNEAVSGHQGAEEQLTTAVAPTTNAPQSNMSGTTEHGERRPSRRRYRSRYPRREPNTNPNQAADAGQSPRPERSEAPAADDHHDLD